MDILMAVIAFVPALFVMIHIYRKDRLEHEPIRLLISLVLLGGLSIVPAIVLEVLGSRVLDSLGIRNETLYLLLYTYVVIGISEEVCKFLAARVRTWKSREFNCEFDGIVYTTFAALGFAIFENFEYVFDAYSTGAAAGIATGLARAVTSIPGHAFFGVFIGEAYGLAKEAMIAGDRVKAKRHIRWGLAKAVFVHGTYDFLAMYGTVGTSIGLILLIILLYVIALRLIRNASLHDKYIVYEMVPVVSMEYPTAGEAPGFVGEASGFVGEAPGFVGEIPGSDGESPKYQ